jgi:hypothetical protein
MVAPPLITTQASFDVYLRDAIFRMKALENIDASYNVATIIRRQLEFMQTATKGGRHPTPDEKAKIDIGPLSVRNFEESDWELARQLQELDYWFNRYEQLPP